MCYIAGGSKNEINNWRKFQHKLKLDGKISFLGFIENKLIPLYHKSANILLAPYSRKCSTVDWMSPIKLFEYMAAKVCIIASDVERIREICNNDECLLFQADNSKDLSEKINLLLEDEDLQRKLINNALEKSKTHTYIKRCKNIIEPIK